MATAPLCSWSAPVCKLAPARAPGWDETAPPTLPSCQPAPSHSPKTTWRRPKLQIQSLTLGFFSLLIAQVVGTALLTDATESRTARVTGRPRKSTWPAAQVEQEGQTVHWATPTTARFLVSGPPTSVLAGVTLPPCSWADVNRQRCCCTPQSSCKGATVTPPAP